MGLSNNLLNNFVMNVINVAPGKYILLERRSWLKQLSHARIVCMEALFCPEQKDPYAVGRIPATVPQP